MKQFCILSLCLLFSAGAIAQTVIIQEVNDPTMNPESHTTFAGDWASWHSSAKSTAPGLFGARTEYSSADTIDATFAFWPEYGGHDTSSYTSSVAFDSGKTWDVYITTPVKICAVAPINWAATALLPVM